MLYTKTITYPLDHDPLQCHDLSDSIGDRYTIMLFVQSINSLKRIRFVIINHLNGIYVPKNAGYIIDLMTLSVAKSIFKEAIICFQRLYLLI